MPAKKENADKCILGRELDDVSKQRNHNTQSPPAVQAIPRHKPNNYRQRLKQYVVCAACLGMIPISWAEWLIARLRLCHD